MTLAALLAISSCTFVVDRETSQCKVDADCAQFGTMLTCQAGTCSAFGPAGCFPGEPTTQLEYLNACSTSSHVPFDNCGRLGLCDEAADLPATVDPNNPTIVTLVNPIPEPTSLCTDGAPGGVIYMLGAADFGPLMKAVQPYLSTADRPYRAVFQNSSSCAGVSAIFESVTMKNPVNPMFGGWAFYFDDQGKQVNCRLDVGGNAIDIGVSDLYAETCDPRYHAGAEVAEYLGPVVPFVLSVPAMSREQSISVEAAHLVFGLGGKAPEGSGLKDAPWNERSNFSIRNAGAASTVLTALLTDVPKAKFWGVDRLSTDNLRDTLLTASKTEVDSSIGILSVDYNDKNRDNLRALYLQSRGQLSGYQPDSSPTTIDKANVRDGHYPLWGYVHFFTSTRGGAGASEAAKAMVLKFNVSRLEQGLLDKVIDASLVPLCAMKVTRQSEIGDYRPQTGYECGCYFDQRTKRRTECSTCETAEDCPGKRACNYGYCELDQAL
ncbi:MAG: hypothetical protein H7138_16845 [Myxococcales bacterium]|nr:hypothetical protein [Myxococcales bacterium]